VTDSGPSPVEPGAPPVEPGAAPVDPGATSAPAAGAEAGDSLHGGPFPPAPVRSRRREALGALLVYLLLTYLFTAATWQDPTNHWVGRCCDQEQSIWFLAWTPTALQLGQNPLLTDRLNAPDGANLMWNGAIPLLGLLFAPITLTAGPVFAYNVAVLLAITLSGLACFLALRRYTKGPLGPLVGGALYAFSPYVASHTVLHLNLINVWAPPLFVVLLDEIVARRRYRPELLGVGLGVLGAIQLVTFEEVLATSAVAGLVLVLAAVLVVHRLGAIRAGAIRLVRAAIPGAAAFAVLGAAPLAVQFLGPQQIHGQVQPPAVFSTDLLNIILPTDYTWIAPGFATDISKHFSGLYHEATGYLGVVLLLVLAWIVVELRRDGRVVVAALTGVVLLVLSLGPKLYVGTEPWNVPMPWAPVADLPLLEHVLPGRITAYVFLAVAAMLAIGIDHATGLARRPAAIRLAAIAAALVFLVPAPARTSTHDVPEFFRTWDRQGIAADDIVLIAPWFTNGAGADPMLWAAVAAARPRLYEGYVYVPAADGRPRFGPQPGGLAKLMIEAQDHGTVAPLTAEQRSAAIAELRDAQVSVVIVGSLRYRTEMVSLLTDLFRTPPVEIDGVQLWRNVQETIAAG
jgi:hypothetical protein